MHARRSSIIVVKEVHLHILFPWETLLMKTVRLFRKMLTDIFHHIQSQIFLATRYDPVHLCI
jgi:hypothetical protein